MNDILNADNNQEPINLGEESTKNQISFQLAQDFYNEITGKSERITEKFQLSFILTLDDITNLNSRLEQSTEQYNIVSQNASFSVKYVGDSSERFSSIERLKLHAGNKGLAIEELDITYKMLIVLPKTQRPQEYKISISFVSRVAKIEEMRKEMEDMPFEIPFYKFESLRTCQFSIDFVDICVAQAIASTIRVWVNSLQRNHTGKSLRFIRGKSSYCPLMVKYLFLALTIFYIHKYSNILLYGDITLKRAVDFSLISVISAFLSLKLGSFIGRVAEKNLDEIYEISYIKFSAADDRLVELSNTKIKQSVLYGIFSLLGALLIGVTASVIAAIILSVSQ